MTDEKWRTALDIYLAAAELPEHERKPFLNSASIDPELIQKVVAALEDVESPAAPPSAAAGTQRIGARIGRYLVTALLGQGGMGEVYAAQDT
jgi:hypothetical protein